MVSPTEESEKSVSADADAIARKSFSKILQRLQEHGTQQKSAKEMGVSESTVSRFKTDQAEQFCRLLASLGLRVEDDRFICMDPKAVEYNMALFGRLLQHPDAVFILSGIRPPSAATAGNQ